VIRPSDLWLEGAEDSACIDDEGLLFDLPFNDARNQVVLDFERKYLTELLRRAGGNVTQAAKMAMKERRTMGRLLKKHNLSTATFQKT